MSDEKPMNPDPLAGLSGRFKAFDHLFSLEGEARPPVTFEDSIARVTRLIDALPQRVAIQDENIERWIKRTYDMAVERMNIEHGEDNFGVEEVHGHVLWHVRRASGIGGSEIGMLVRHFRGESGGFGSARNLVLEKLLVMAPTPPTPEMARGTRAEPWVQRMFHEANKVRSHEPSLARLRGFRWDRAPYLAGTPDDITHAEDDDPENPARLDLGDYKAPSADVCQDYEANGISFDYKAQLHHYAILAMASGSRFASMAVNVFDPRHFAVTPYPVEFDRALAKEITTAASRIWRENVMTGVLPDPAGLFEMRTDDPDMIDLGHQAAMFRTLKDIVEAREKECLQRLIAIGSEGHENAVGKIPLGVAALSRSRAWDEEMLRSLADAAGIDVRQFESRTEKFDKDRAQVILRELLQAIEDGDTSVILQEIAEEGLPKTVVLDADGLASRLEEMGVDIADAAGLKQSFSISRKKKGPEADAVRRLKIQAAELAEAIEDVVAASASRIITGEPDEEELQPE